MGAMGSLAWGRSRGGRLTWAERLGYLGLAVRARLGATLRKRGADGLRLDLLDLDKLRLPDTRLVAQVLEVCAGAYEPWLLNHCLRTWLWGGLVGQAERIAVDAEALLVSSLLHDLGLTPAAARPGCDCFAVRGALLAERVLTDLGHPELAFPAAESIALHLNVRVPRSAPPLSYLLHQGATIDVVGWNLGKVKPLKAAVLALHPRLELKRHLRERLAAEVADHPRTRVALMVRLGFADLLQRAPYPE